MDTDAPLQRRLGAADATFIGLGSMIGAGVFAVFAPAAGLAGPWLLLGLLIAALVAFCNAASSAQLAATYPRAGGTYVFGRERLGEWWGFAAGWMFVIGKVASCAAMALVVAQYAVPEPWTRPVAVVAVVAVAAVAAGGITKTAAVARVIVVLVAAVLGLVVLGALAGDASTGLSGAATATAGVPVVATPYDVLQSAALIFFAFAGYARIATLGEEVRDPRRSIPRAILGAFVIAVVVYAAVGGAVLSILGPRALADSTAPLADAVRAVGWGWAVPIVGVGAALAALGALLGLLVGVSRTVLAMARTGDLPRPLARVHPDRGVPHRAELVVAAIVVAVILLADVRSAIAFSSFGVLLYYFVTNLSAITQPRADRLYPRVIPALGMLGCVTLVATLPPAAIALGSGVVAAGLLGRVVVRRLAARRA